MKKTLAWLILLSLLLSLWAIPAYADSDTLTVQTRSGSYTFQVGDTFEYNYWLNLSPDILAELGYSEAGALSILGGAVLNEVSGNIMFDTDHLEVVDTAMPQFSEKGEGFLPISIPHGFVYVKNDVVGRTGLDGTVLDFTDGDIFFKSLFLDEEEELAFCETNVLVSVTFRVTDGSDIPVYMRTKIKKLNVTYGSKEIEFIDNKNSIAIVPFASYETIDDAEPQELLDPYVGDQGFDIRCCLRAGDTEHYLRPGPGVAVTLNGVTKFGEVLHMTRYSSGDPVYWFYDIPYGEYFVSCSYVSEAGTKYGTPKLSKGEYVSIPSTGIVQALWLFEFSPMTFALPDYPDIDGPVCAYADGKAVPFSDGTVTLDGKDYRTLVVCSFNGDDPDVHKNYPQHMYVWTLVYSDEEYRAIRQTCLDDVLQYAGSSIRITGTKGIRMITGVPETARKALIGNANGFRLQEYGTVVAWKDALGDSSLTLDFDGAKSRYAYKRAVADPIYRRANGAVQYTNVLVGFSDEQCIPELVMRPYMIVTNALGEELTIYGGPVTRSIGYIAYQNRAAFTPGSSSYEYIWGIIHCVYGDTYDDDYKG